MFLKNKKEGTLPKDRLILGMVLLPEVESFDTERFTIDYTLNYEPIKDSSGDKEVYIFTTDDQMVAISHVPAPIPKSEIQNTAQYAYNWETAIEDTNGHKSHLIVTIMKGSIDPVQKHKLLTKVMCSLLRTTDAIGIYKGTQFLLIHKEDYLDEAGPMEGNHLPLNLWVYIGLRVSETGHSAYTCGLKEFGKKEMEILDSDHSLSDIRIFLLNVSHYVLLNDITFQAGQTFGTSAEEKIMISLSKGVFAEGDTFKLAY